MSEFRNRTIAYVTIAAVCMLTLGSIFNYALPLQSESTSLSSSTKSSSSGTTLAFGGTPGIGIRAYYSSFNLAVVSQFTDNAYSYSPAEANVTITSNLTFAYVPILVISAQQVAGNWSTGYQISYTGIKLLNVTTTCLANCDDGGNYTAIKANITSLASRATSLSFGSMQQRAIEVALSNATVSDLAPFPTYYVESVTTNQSPTNSSSSDIRVSLYQADGTHILNVFINSNLTQAVAILQATRPRF